MSANNNAENLRKLVNSSGFPFQLRVAQEVASTQSSHRWEVIAQEYPWRDEITGREGFIDSIIARPGAQRMVLESKRTRDADWVFLIPVGAVGGTGDRGTHVRCLWTYASSEYQPQVPESSANQLQCRSGWHDFYAEPESYISEFCVVRGTGEGQKPMLENLCRILLNAVESLAGEELSLASGRGRTVRYIYVPVIVTNANLHVCRYSVDTVSLHDGNIPAGDFEEVPYIRFRKSLATTLTESNNINSIEIANRDRNRTVIVVQAQHLVNFLSNWAINERERQPAWG